ncbi:MAG: hypothetical protein EB059_10230 [Alphaproteobacteria bacterium]|nr:hypothetical protein [Alphaproteobacteria bacterium]
MLPEHAKNKTLEFWFQDEARVGQKGTLTRIWAKKGTRPRMRRDQRHTNAYIFGAVCPSRDIGVALVLPDSDTNAMNHHLAALGKQVAAQAHAVVIVDGAGWHIADDLRIPDNISNAWQALTQQTGCIASIATRDWLKWITS